MSMKGAVFAAHFKHDEARVDKAPGLSKIW